MPFGCLMYTPALLIPYVFLLLLYSLPGRTYAEVENIMEKLWNLCFRTLDDMKESVCFAGLEMAKSLSQLTARLTNREETPADQVHSHKIQSP